VAGDSAPLLLDHEVGLQRRQPEVGVQLLGTVGARRAGRQHLDQQAGLGGEHLLLIVRPAEDEHVRVVDAIVGDPQLHRFGVRPARTAPRRRVEPREHVAHDPVVPEGGARHRVHPP
jgi:hypothetical protein